MSNDDKSIRISGATVWNSSGPADADIVVVGERIAALVDRAQQFETDETINADGAWIFPGLVDLHAHTRVPGFEYKEDYLSASSAAAIGGFTTFVDMPNVEPPTTTVALLREKREIARQSCLVDWGHFAGATELQEIPELARAGAAGFKIFQVSGAYPHDPRLAIEDSGQLYNTFVAIQATGLPCLVHPFDQSLFDTLSELALARGEARDVKTFARVYTEDVVWRTAVAKLLELQRETGVRLQLLHTNSPGSLRLIRDAKASGVPVVVASDPKYFHLTKRDLDAQGARVVPGGVISEDRDRVDEIWRALRDGTIDIADSDHAPHTLDDFKGMDKDPWNGAFGSPQYQDLLSLWLTDIDSGLISIERVVELLSAAPAKVLGVYPEKGAIAVGACADLVIIDPTAVVKPSDESAVTKSRWTPYLGHTFVGAPIMTMLRGRVIAEGGKISGEPGFAQFVTGRPQLGSLALGAR